MLKKNNNDTWRHVIVHVVTIQINGKHVTFINIIYCKVLYFRGVKIRGFQI